MRHNSHAELVQMCGKNMFHITFNNNNCILIVFILALILVLALVVTENVASLVTEFQWQVHD